MNYEFLHPQTFIQCKGVACEDLYIKSGVCKCWNHYKKLPGIKKILEQNINKNERSNEKLL